MYNANRPKLSELPSPARLLRSTLVAATSAAAILVAVVLPSEYGIDPTGAGRVLGLTKMGVIKMELAAEAAADRAAAEAVATAPVAPAPDLSGLYQRIDALESAVRNLTSTIKAAQAPINVVATKDQIDAAGQSDTVSATAAQTPSSETEPAAETAATEVAAASAAIQPTSTAAEAPAEPPRRDSATFTLSPGQGIEIKLAMKKGAKANYAWVTEGGPVNFDTHGDGAGDLKISYEKGRGVQSDEGTLIAEFDGNHGWFWRNRGQEPVTLTLNTAGYYSAIKGIPN